MSFNFAKKRPLIVSGPCSAESKEQVEATCYALASTGKVDLFRAGIWKPRTQPGCFEGIGVKGLPWVQEIQKKTGIPVAVEVATAKHVEQAYQHDIRVMWVGARTTVSPFAVQELADAMRGKDISLLIKNPMNPDVALWDGAVKRFLAAGIPAEKIALVHRGFSYFGHTKYRNVPMWHILLHMKSLYPNMVTLCDSSHICGCREYLQEISQTAADLCLDGLFIESHISPDTALSDANQQLTPSDFETLIDSIIWRKENADNEEYNSIIELHRSEIDQIDAELLDLFHRRMQISEKIGREKKKNGVAILQSPRWEKIVSRSLYQAQKLGLSPDFMTKVLEAIHVESIEKQKKIMNE